MPSRPRYRKSSRRRRRGKSSEHPFIPGTAQHDFITADLAAASQPEARNPAPSSRAKLYAQEVKQELERLFALGQGFAPQYDPAVEVSYVDDGSHSHPIPALSVKIGMRESDGKINEFVILGLSHDKHMPALSNTSMVRRMINHFDANTMYVDWLGATPHLTGSQVMERILQFAKCFNYRRVALDDQSVIGDFRSGSGGGCSISLGAYLLLTRGERWYSRFGFELVFPVEKDKEVSAIREIREMQLNELELTHDSSQPTAADVLGYTPKSSMKLGELFDLLGGGHLDERGICYVASIFRNKRIHGILKTLPPKMELVLPSWLAQTCLGRVPSALLPTRTRRLLRSGVPPIRS